MEIGSLHNWAVSPREAIKLQVRLAKSIRLRKGDLEIKTIAGADIAYSKTSNKVFGGVIIFTYPKLEVIEERLASQEVKFPYIPGLLTFREAPVLLAAFKKVKNVPDLIIFDGQGIAHPRKMGLATHMGIILNKPTIGCAKSRLLGDYKIPRNVVGAYSLLRDGNKVIGAVLRTRKDVKPVFVSAGYKIDLKTSIKVVSKCAGNFRLPEPTRQAHIFVEKAKRKREGSSI